jgi:hypothetical protein
MRVVATLSTIPSRIDRIRPTIESLLRQTYPVERVEVNVPYWCVRTAEPYKVPDWLTAMDGVDVHRTEDYGAITKIAPTLIRHAHEPVYVWSVDDDFVYHPKHLKTMMDNADGKSVLCLHGGVWTPHGYGGGMLKGKRNVDIVEGFAGIVYPPNCIREDFLSYVEQTSADWDNRKSDDIILSNYFATHDIPMVKVLYDTNMFTVQKGEQRYGNEPDALKNQDDGHYVRYIRVLDWLKKTGLCGWKDLPKMVQRVGSRPAPHTVHHPKRQPPAYTFLPPPPPPPPPRPTSTLYFAYALKGKNKPLVITNEQGTDRVLVGGRTGRSE